MKGLAICSHSSKMWLIDALKVFCPWALGVSFNLLWMVYGRVGHDTPGWTGYIEVFLHILPILILLYMSQKTAVKDKPHGRRKPWITAGLFVAVIGDVMKIIWINARLFVSGDPVLLVALFFYAMGFYNTNDNDKNAGNNRRNNARRRHRSQTGHTPSIFLCMKTITGTACFVLGVLAIWYGYLEYAVNHLASISTIALLAVVLLGMTCLTVSSTFGLLGTNACFAYYCTTQFNVTLDLMTSMNVDPLVWSSMCYHIAHLGMALSVILYQYDNYDNEYPISRYRQQTHQ